MRPAVTISISVQYATALTKDLFSLDIERLRGMTQMDSLAVRLTLEGSVDVLHLIGACRAVSGFFARLLESVQASYLSHPDES